jgi:hypothetical protein
MKKIKITRPMVIIALILFGVALVFLNFWMFGETKLFNDTIHDSSLYGKVVDFGWIHLAVNTILVLFDIAYLIFAIWEFSDDNPPFAFLYEDDRYSYRHKNEEEEEQPRKPIHWRRWVFYIVLLFCIVNVFKFGKTIYKQSVFMYNTSKKYQNTYQQKVEEKLGFYDKLWKTYQTKAQITNMNKDVFIEVTKIIMANVADGENLSWKWISKYPDIDYNQFTAFYADLSNYITKQREGYFSIEKVCQTIANQNNTMLDTFPNNLYNRALKLPRIKFEYGFLSDSTNNVFTSKVENLK